MSQTKADQLSLHLYSIGLVAEGDELRRLAPMEAHVTALQGSIDELFDTVEALEAERDKLLAVNKVLVDALKLISETEQSKFAQAYCANMATTALKLTGEIK